MSLLRLLNTTAGCFRAGLVSGKLLISRCIRSSKRLTRTDGRSVVPSSLTAHDTISSSFVNYQGFPPAMHFTRRGFARLGVGAPPSLSSTLFSGQGVPLTAKSLPRPAPSGHPFNARLIDIGHDRLRAPIIYLSTATQKPRNTS